MVLQIHSCLIHQYCMGVSNSRYCLNLFLLEFHVINACCTSSFVVSRQIFSHFDSNVNCCFLNTVPLYTKVPSAAYEVPGLFLSSNIHTRTEGLNSNVYLLRLVVAVRALQCKGYENSKLSNLSSHSSYTGKLYRLNMLWVYFVL